jgi:hypothetical protein
MAAFGGTAAFRVHLVDSGGGSVCANSSRLLTGQYDVHNSDPEAAVTTAARRMAPMPTFRARSVGDDPAVRAATQALDLARPDTFQPLAEARLAAQERAGIPGGNARRSRGARD